MKRYRLLKCEPSVYTIDDPKRDTRTSWEGVRNCVLFYASNADPSAVTGLATLLRAGCPAGGGQAKLLFVPFSTVNGASGTTGSPRPARCPSP